MDPSFASLFQMTLALSAIWQHRAVTSIIAHRGASALETENTVAAMARAGELGADGVELDVRRTGDDQLVVHHDPRLADGSVIRELRAAELPDQVPTLDAALDACAGMFVNIEIKNDPDEPDFDASDWLARRVCVALSRRGGGPRWLISSFRLETVGACRRAYPDLRTAWLVSSLDEEVVARTVAGGHLAVHPCVASLDQPSLRLAHAAGLAVNPWTCDDPARIRELIAWGVDGICTNVPDVAIAVRNELLESGG
jgi:glycerophosphoryl diester phosphodiesterase